eukprot:COSAG02_NODE_45798_length_354_cov_0.607843_2_plen_20_part_01
MDWIQSAAQTRYRINSFRLI